MEMLSYALTFFLVTNAIGNAPMVLALVKDFPLEKQKKILLREGIISLLIALFFLFAGPYFLSALHASPFALALCGGILLFLVSLQMIFPKSEKTAQVLPKQEPFIVPIATPLISGAGLMTIIMISSTETGNPLMILGSILICFTGVIGVMMGAPYLQKLLGKAGLLALEQIMGMILALISMEMIVNGSHLFVKTL